MEQTKLSMIDEARHNNDCVIYPIKDYESFDECFTHDEDLDLLMLWYDKDIGCGRTTGVITRPLPN